MLRHHDQGGSKSARHLSRRDIPIRSVISGALGGLSNALPPNPISDDPPADPQTPVPLPTDLPSAIASSFSLPVPIPLPPDSPSDTNSTDSSSKPTEPPTNNNSTSSSSTQLSPSSSRPTSNTDTSKPSVSSMQRSPPSSNNAPSSPSSLPPSHFSPPVLTNTGRSTITEVFTTTSGSVTLAITTTIPPSLSSNPGSETPFFKNKGQAAAILTVLILLGILGFGFLGFRFVKTVKKRQLERDLQEATRLHRSRAVLDDDDGDAYAVNSIRQTESSVWSMSQPVVLSSKQSLDRYAASMKSMSALGDSGAGHSSFEVARPSRGLRRRVSTEEDDVSPGNSNGSVSRAYLNGGTGSAAASSSSHTYSSTTSHSSQSPFFSRTEQLQLPTPPVLPETFGEDTRPLNPVLSDTTLEGDKHNPHLPKQSLKIANE